MSSFKPNYFQRRSKPKGPRANERIRALDVQVIGSDGGNLGAMPLNKAIELAKKALPAWKAKPAKERGKILKVWHEMILENIEDLANLEPGDYVYLIEDSFGCQTTSCFSISNNFLNPDPNVFFGFEDTYGGGDKDYDDMIFSFNNIQISSLLKNMMC